MNYLGCTSINDSVDYDYRINKNKTQNICPMRHENGNCLAVGGFCTAVNDEICQSLHNAYEMGKASLNIVHCNDCKYEKDCENLYSIFCNGYCNLGKRPDKE